MKRLESEIETVVAFYDLDPMQIVWHGNYARYFELARCELLSKIGYDYDAMKTSGFAWPVIDLKIRFVKPAVFGQKLVCKAWVMEYENQLKIGYEICCAESKDTLTRGSTTQVAVNGETEEMQLVSPRILHDRMKAAYENL